MGENDENRFGYFRKKSNEELNRIRNDLLKENREMENAKNISSFQRSEFHEDIKFNEEQISFINMILDDNSNKRGR